MLEEFIKFCASKPAGLRYVWADDEKCPIGQFVKLKNLKYDDTPIEWENLAFNHERGQTWGLLTERLIAFKKSP